MLYDTGITGETDRGLHLAAIRALQGDGLLIYAIRCPSGLIKIGASGDLISRFHKLQPTAILAIRQGTRAEELAIHHRLKAHRALGREYYHETPKVIAEVNELRDAFGLPPLAAA